MPRLFVVLLFFVVILALGYALISAARRLGAEADSILSTGSYMQRISFFLLAALMIYVAFVGAA